MGKNKVIIMGGGASGMMAAIIAARLGSKVTILERCDRIGKKILATGNGRCNLTNTTVDESNYFIKEPHKGFVNQILDQFNVQTTLDFFHGLGIEIVEKEDGKLYPRSDQASSVLAVLMAELEHLKVEILCNQTVQAVEVDKSIRVQTQDQKFYCNKFVVATGGKSTPELGSDGSGYTLAKELGHTLTPVFPSLVQIKTDYPYLKHLKGTKIQGCARLHNEKKEVLQTEVGEILYTDYGISGPPILQISRIASDRIHQNLDTYVTIDLIPEIEIDELDLLLRSRFEQMPYKSAENILIGLINSRLIVPMLKTAEVALSKKAADFSKAERKNLCKAMKNACMKVTGINPWNQSQVTAGGVALSEVSKDLESRLKPNVYFCGEILDVDGLCGGYNLQWAWSSGAVVGRQVSNTNSEA
ncbi:MAG: NAD(P)/FAD-dependent oxidoreductase [Vallitaleaceae bacterium]|nr:NAD(P)/FAD-dependent oxidoreductase [Vallitaleaceae bacterium]